MLGSREEPSHEVDGADRHADAEDNPGKGSFAAAFAESENETANHYGDEREARGDRAGERVLQDLDSILPRREAGLLAESVFSYGQTSG
jgi:hypothetical protein